MFMLVEYEIPMPVEFIKQFARIIFLNILLNLFAFLSAYTDGHSLFQRFYNFSLINFSWDS